MLNCKWVTANTKSAVILRADLAKYSVFKYAREVGKIYSPTSKTREAVPFGSLLQISQTPVAYVLNAFVHPFDTGSEVNLVKSGWGVPSPCKTAHTMAFDEKAPSGGGLLSVAAAGLVP